MRETKTYVKKWLTITGLNFPSPDGRNVQQDEMIIRGARKRTSSKSGRGLPLREKKKTDFKKRGPTRAKTEEGRALLNKESAAYLYRKGIEVENSSGLRGGGGKPRVEEGAGEEAVDLAKQKDR